MSPPPSLATKPELKPERCAYCDAPLPATDQNVRSPGTGTRFCCYGCRVLAEAGHKPVETSTLSGSPWFKITIAAVLAGQAMLLGLAVNLAPPTGLTRTLLHGALIVAALAALAILGRPLLQCALDEVRHRRISIELLFLAGIAGALGASLCSTLTGQGAVYYEVVAVLITVYSVGRTLGAQSRARALAETRHLQRTFDSCHKLAADGSVVEARVAEIAPGDQVRVLPGEPIPIDGCVTLGQAFVCETPLTGEPFPVVRRPGDAVFAGSYSEDGELRITATAPGHDRRLDRLISALESARERPSRIQAQADALVAWFLPLVLLISLATFVFWTWRDHWSAGLFNAMAVLLVACPCALGLATPLALWNGLAALAARGLVVRGGNVLERLASLDLVVFDKTGTLSEERFSLIDLAAPGGAEARDRITAQLRAVEQASSHPVARAFHGAGSNTAALSPRVRSIKTIPALGVEAWIESGEGTEHHLRVGQRGLMSDLKPEAELLSGLRRSACDHLIYVERDGSLCAIAAVRERVRDSAAQALLLLEQQGAACAVMTGDRAERAAQLLETLSIEGGLTPEGKAERLERLKEAGRKVGFVGDGVNDAPAMRESSVGIALAHGAGVTTAGADAVLYGGDLRVLPWAIGLARQVRGSIHSNLIFAAVYNIIGMALAAAGFLHPVAAALLMVVSSFTVSWRALRSVEVAGCCVAPRRDPGVPEAPASIPAKTRNVSGDRRFVVQPLGYREALEQAKAWTTNGAWSRFASNLRRLSLSMNGPAWCPPFRVSVGPNTIRAQAAYGLLVIAQVPFLIYLGQLGLLGSLVTSAVLLALGLFMIRFRTQSGELARVAGMTFAMLGPGNWGMLLGWWADGGFGPVSTGCPHCGSHGFGPLAFADMPWMNLGMMLFGLPPMILDRSAQTNRWGRFALALLSAVGMVWGMGLGNHVFIKWLGPLLSESFLLSFAGMTIGMLLGMFLCCELGRAILLSRLFQPRRRR